VASLTTVNTNGLTFGGLVTGINPDTIIAGLTKIAQQRIDTYTNRQKDIVDKQTTFASLQGKLFDLQGKTAALARSAGGAFDARKAASSDDTAATATAGTAAVPGTYTLTVGSLARANQLASAGFADPNAQIKQGTLTLKVGGGAATTVTIDSKNNTLQGLADAVNAAGGDVKASVINDGSAAPYRLLLTSAKTGAANAITVTNNLSAGSGADIDPAATTVQAASDASVTLGSGAGAITVSSGTNQVTNLIPGVSVNLLRADSAKPLTLSVTADTGGAATAVKDFVDSYNAVLGFIGDQTAFDASSGTVGKLLGNRDIGDLEADLSAVVTGSVPGLSSTANRLSVVGVTVGDDGKLTLDEGKLNAALSGSGGVSLADVKRLFGLNGTSDTPGVDFAFGTSKTKPSGAGPVQVVVTSPATRATAAATNALAASTLLDATNNTLLFKLNGKTSGGITLDPGAYTPAGLAALLQQKINADAGLAGGLVSVGLDAGGKLTFTSQQYGSSSAVGFAGGTALAALGLTGLEAGTGQDVAGKFVVNGQTETATGSGQALTGTAGNPTTDGLQVKVSSSTPATANLSVTQGLAGRLNAVLNNYLDAGHGRLKTVNDDLQAQYDDLGKSITKDTDALQQRKDDLTQRFADMETAVSSLKNIGASLAALIPKSSS
jgi:flagellar hook-associated protein 2